jgi:dynactin 1
MQLDDALGAEDMVVQLTERTLTLGEVTAISRMNDSSCLCPIQKIEEMRVTIEDLEALKELSEELEENHVETERAMLDEISTCLGPAQQAVHR